jgi:hypothetical protein
MTCAGISSLVITGLWRSQEKEVVVRNQVQNCGKFGLNGNLLGGLNWMSGHFRVTENLGAGQQWRFYYLEGLERAGRLTGQRFFGAHDWYREGAEKLVQEQDKLQGSWTGAGPVEGEAPVGVVTTSFALFFLARGRTPVLIQKARHAPKNDWQNDPDDVRNLVGSLAREWKRPLKWQVVDLDTATVDDLALAPILFLNGHRAPVLEAPARAALRAYAERGGLILGEACCSKKEFDQEFRKLVQDLFPAPASPLHVLDADHPVWRVRHQLRAKDHPLWGVELGGRTVLIYSPEDLSCRWNLKDWDPRLEESSTALKLGHNVAAYASGD